ncbi:MAG: hypothetical protein JNM58_05525 [Xanthomonadaceae bacterium]|nr:hypothetical protein [Xanthomonadaceae bacterium]
MSHDFGFERVYVELEIYDGPRVGIADVHGVPHRFSSKYDENDAGGLGTFSIVPIDPSVLELEQAQWSIYVAWNRRCEAGASASDLHPGEGGVDSRWDELQVLLAESRGAFSACARQAKAEKQWIERDERYAEDGPDYRMRWTLL